MIGRYVVGGPVASGGMAAVHLGQIRGAVGFARTVAIKRMHPHLAGDSDFATMFADEARLAARIRHPNVVSTLDVVLEDADLCIVMEYIPGVTLAQLAKLVAEQGAPMPPAIAAAVARDVLNGLHAAHEAVDEAGSPLGIVHRDVSPQNVIVGVDGVARVLNFGIAKANVRLHETREGGGLKGKLGYMAPEQLEGAPVDRRSDIFAASVVLWEALTAQRAYPGATEGEVVARLLRGTPAAPSAARPALGAAYDAVVMRGLARSCQERYANAREMALALAATTAIAPAEVVGAWVERVAAQPLAERAACVRALETALHADDGEALAVRDPDETRPATVATLDAVPPPPPSSARAVAVAAPPPRTAPGSTALRVAALVAVACGITALSVGAWSSHARPPAPVATVAAAPPADPSTMPALAPGASSSAAPPAELPLPAAPPLAASGRAKRSAPRPASRSLPPSIPDHL